MQENEKVMKHHHGENTSGLFEKTRPNMIKGPAPYQILEKLTSQTKKDMKFAGRRCVIRFISIFAEKNL